MPEAVGKSAKAAQVSVNQSLNPTCHPGTFAGEMIDLPRQPVIGSGGGAEPGAYAPSRLGHAGSVFGPFLPQAVQRRDSPTSGT